jgi:hypothetical protein
MQLGLENDIVTSVHCEGTVDRLKPHNVLRAVVPLSVVVLLLFVFPANGASKSPFGKTIREQVGVNIHFTAGQPGEMDELRDAGFGFVRMDFSWGDTEKQSGVYDFHQYDQLLSDLDHRNIRALWILDYGNNLYDKGGNPVGVTARAAFAKWAAAVVTHFKGHRILWEMWNEPNPNWTPDYIKLAIATGQAIKAAAPQEYYVGPAEAGTDPTFLENLFKAGLLNYWCAVTVHPYRSSNPETSTPEIRTIQALIAKYKPAGAKISLVSGEWGYAVMPNENTYSFVKSDEQQASYFDREILTNLANGLPLSIWYDWKNDGDNPNDTEANFGLVHFTYHASLPQIYEPKPSYVAAKAFLTLLGDYQFASVNPVNPSTGSLIYTFARHHNRRYVVYTTSDQPETVVVHLPAGNYSLEDMLGRKQPDLTSTATGATITLSGEPEFVIPARTFHP